MKNKAISQMQANIFKWMMPGFVIMMITGVLLFWCQAEKAYNSIFFRIKVLALILAGVNILYFHLKTQRSQADWDTARIPPTNARLAGLFSILLWAIIIAAGRLMAYTF
jgi:heme/copper-type cytochrome/quinol oxidase subunit 4